MGSPNIRQRFFLTILRLEDIHCYLKKSSLAAARPLFSYSTVASGRFPIAGGVMTSMSCTLTYARSVTRKASVALLLVTSMAHH